MAPAKDEEGSVDEIAASLDTVALGKDEEKKGVHKAGPARLPRQSDVKNIFHIYKDPLMRKKSLPAEVTVSNPGHEKTLLDVLRNHPRASAKFGDGVVRVFLRRSVAGGTEVCCCYVERIDGSEEDFSIFKPYRQVSYKDAGERFDATTGQVLRRTRNYWE